MNKLFDFLVRAFNVVVTTYVVMALVAAAFLVGAWCLLWAMLSSTSN